MTHKEPVLFFMILLGTAVFAQHPTSPEELLKTGIGFYGEGRFSEAHTVLGLVKPGEGPYAEALYWSSLADLSGGNYNGALLSLDKLEKAGGRWSADVPYHRARCLFYQGKYEEALPLFEKYGASLPESDPRRAAAYYWAGESLFALGRLDGAADVFSAVVDKYPSSVKHEAASYRLSLINQKKIEAELLGLLKWSHEESLKSLEEYQGREQAYEAAVAAYQQKIGELLAAEKAGSGEYGEYKEELTRAELRITALEASLAEANAALEELRGTGVAVPEPAAPRPMTDTERALRILELKAAALQLSNTLTKKLSGE